MSVDDLVSDPGSSAETPAFPQGLVESGPLGWLPRVALHQSRLQSRLARVVPGSGLAALLGWLNGPLGSHLDVGEPEVVWRAAGIRRSGLVSQFTWPRLSTRFAFGLETPVAHAIVDRLLGFDRLAAESRLALSPVEWGILTYVVAETHRRLAEWGNCPFGVWDATIDRVGPDPFDTTNLGPVVTIRWPLRLGDATGALRLWVSEGLVARWLKSDEDKPHKRPEMTGNAGDLSGVWRALSGTISLPRGLRTLRRGGILPLVDSTIRGTPSSPTGPVELTLQLAGPDGRFTIPAVPVPQSGGGRLTVAGAFRHDPTPREGIPVNPRPAQANPEPNAPEALDVPVTLAVELGRVNLTISRLADLKPGDVLELGRHSREPVELTSGGRLVARGELVLIDTELGVRVTHLFL